MTSIRTVRTLMNPDVMTVADDMTTDELARYLVEREISGAPVVDSQGRLVGVVSMTDIGRHVAEPGDAERSGFSADEAFGLTPDVPGPRMMEGAAVSVRDVMTPTVHVISATASAGEAARLMVEERVHRLVVTDGHDPVGIITSMDLLKMLATRP